MPQPQRRGQSHAVPDPSFSGSWSRRTTNRMILCCQHSGCISRRRSAHQSPVSATSSAAVPERATERAGAQTRIGLSARHGGADTGTMDHARARPPCRNLPLDGAARPGGLPRPGRHPLPGLDRLPPTAPSRGTSTGPTATPPSSWPPPPAGAALDHRWTINVGDVRAALVRPDAGPRRTLEPPTDQRLARRPRTRHLCSTPRSGCPAERTAAGYCTAGRSIPEVIHCSSKSKFFYRQVARPTYPAS
ncbi:hypothetical protein BX283_7819 [Streptomyces sp. TLI_146]|nr:hypothetical protein BX283_7819 [Streptomyces sp. TLI_146]